jgi:hypothetical protein
MNMTAAIFNKSVDLLQSFIKKEKTLKQHLM